MTKIYKIRRKADGKYSTGTCKPKFFPKGKAWQSFDAIKKHFDYESTKKYSPYYYIADYEIVEFETIETKIFSIKKDIIPT